MFFVRLKIIFACKLLYIYVLYTFCREWFHNALDVGGSNDFAHTADACNDYRWTKASSLDSSREGVVIVCQTACKLNDIYKQ